MSTHNLRIQDMDLYGTGNDAQATRRSTHDLEMNESTGQGFLEPECDDEYPASNETVG
jgi:hypothetical protein